MIGDLALWIEAMAVSPWFPLLVLVVAALDAVFPVVPSESMVIVGGAACAFGDQHLALIVATAASGAFAGDLTSYTIGRSAGDALWRRAGDRSRRRLLWAGSQLQRRGTMFIVTARFVPGGRTAVTLASGLTSQPRRRFVTAVGLAVLIWAGYGAGLGYVFGAAFADDHVGAVLWALAAAAVLTVAFELGRRLADRRRETDRGVPRRAGRGGRTEMHPGGR